MRVGVSVSREKLNGTLMWMKWVDVAYLLEGRNKRCKLLGSTKLESSSFCSGCRTAWALSILRPRSSKQKKMNEVEMKVLKQGVAALAKKLRAPILSQPPWRIFARISSSICILFVHPWPQFEVLLWLLCQGVELCSQLCPSFLWVLLKEKKELKQSILW